MSNPGHEPTIGSVPASPAAPGAPVSAPPPPTITTTAPPPAAPTTSSTHTTVNEKEAIPNSKPNSLRVRDDSEKRASSTSLVEDPADKVVPHGLAKAGSSSSSEDEKPIAKKKGLGDLFKKKPKVVKKDEDGDDILTPVSIPRLFRFATRFEITLNFIGLFLACLAGATQPLMTLIFGRLTSSFNNFGRIMRQIAEQGMTPENVIALETAKKVLKKDAGNNALYLMAIGLGLVSRHN